MAAMSEYKDIWIRFAGNAFKIREGNALGWRCFPDKSLPEIPLRGLRVEGAADGRNIGVGTSPTAEGPLRLAAWFDFYGDVKIEDGVAHITLKTPPQ